MEHDHDHPVAALAAAQHGVISARQLADLGAEAEADLVSGRLRPVLPGVYAVGTRVLTPEGRSTAGVLAALAGLSDEPMPPELRAAVHAARAPGPAKHSS